MHRGLRGAAARRIGRIAIQAVLCDVDIETAQIDGAELIERVVDLVEFVSGVGGAAIRDHIFQAIEDPAIDEGKGISHPERSRGTPLKIARRSTRSLDFASLRSG